MSTLTAQQILAADDLKWETVHVKEWGGDVIVIEMSGAQRNKLRSFVRDNENVADLDNWQGLFLSMVLVDDDHKPLFTEEQVGDLTGKSNACLQLLIDKAQEISGIGEDAQDEAAKNSPATPSGGNGSDSHDS